MLNKTLPHLPLRNLDGERLFDYFLISGISSILTIRLFLYLTGYPQLGNGSFHVDHMLWGGFFMLSALVVSFFFLTRSARATSAVLGGLGFGMFIDELGKLVTRDDNYLYQPVIALIYSIFVLLYLFSRIIEKQRKVTQKEYLINSLETIKEAVEDKMNVEDKTEALRLLKKAGLGNQLSQSLVELVKQLPAKPVISTSGHLNKIESIVQFYYQRLSQTGWFLPSFLVLFLVKSLLSSSTLLIFIHSPLTFLEFAEIFSIGLSGLLVLIGLWKLPHSHLGTYRFFKYSILTSIFLTQFFSFYRNQLSALSELFINIVFFLALNFLIDQEILSRKRAP